MRTAFRRQGRGGRREFLRRLLPGALLALTWLSSMLAPMRPAAAQTPTPDAQAQALFNRMSPVERLGQLFLLTFTGTNSGADSHIHDLIANHYIGGVILTAANDNFTAAPNTVPNAQALIESLQRAAWDSSLGSVVDPATGQLSRLNYVPLWIGLSQEGNGYPNDQVLSGFTQLPSEMALGATWNPALAEQTGQAMGEELAFLGVNLYLGPSLDVLESPNPTASGDLGTRVFGGDPFWVGEMGRAYIAGLHEGSRSRMAVIAKYFPGSGGTDRSTEEEVSTVRKSLEQLKQIELAPFFAVTGDAPSQEASANGLLISHIRYQGLQGNIRATTRPVSFDSQALTQILNLPEFAGWRAAGGLVVSDDLQSRAVRDFYGEPFLTRNAARDAFLAGNDLLYIGQNAAATPEDYYNSILQTLAFFNQKYAEDPVFARQVDAAVLRILTQKLRLYGEFRFPTVMQSQNQPVDGANRQDLVSEIARRAVTLISPNAQDLTTLLPSPPQVSERLVFITDVGLAKQCSTCPETPLLAVDALQQAILRLYGPGSGNQTSSFRVASYSFDNLHMLLEGTSPQFMESDLGRADWIVISLVDTKNGQVDLLRRFLAERQDSLRSRRVILFAFGAPYYLDATDISKLTAYYVLYSRGPAFVDVAARVLFEEVTPTGFPPVSVQGVGYDLITVMTPDPDQIIGLSLDLAGPEELAGQTQTPEPTLMPLFRIGDTIAVRTDSLLDHNGHPVPDGTVVRFTMLLTGEGSGILQQVDAVTQQGVARASFGLDKPGLLEIKASSEPAVVSEALRMDVSLAGGAAVTVVVPVLTETPVTETPPPPTPRPDPYVSPEGYPKFSAWLLELLMLVGVAWLAYGVASRLRGGREGVRWSLCVLVGGLLAYNYIALGLPGVQGWTAERGMAGILAFTLGGQLLGVIAATIWSRRISASKSQSG